MEMEMDLQRRNKNNKEPDYCHPSCSKERPCGEKVCPHKNQGNKKKKSKNKAKKQTSCHRNCTEDNPCLREVCQYKTQQPDVGNIAGTPEVNPPSQGGIFGKRLFLGFLLGLIFGKLIGTF